MSERFKVQPQTTRGMYAPVSISPEDARRRAAARKQIRHLIDTRTSAIFGVTP